MAVSKEILAAQQEYASRPFAVRWVDSHCACTNRFNTFNEAFDYAQYAWSLVRKTVSQEKYHASRLWACYLETPEGKMSLNWYFLTEDVSSY